MQPGFPSAERFGCRDGYRSVHRQRTQRNERERREGSESGRTPCFIRPPCPPCPAVVKRPSWAGMSSRTSAAWAVSGLGVRAPRVIGRRKFGPSCEQRSAKGRHPGRRSYRDLRRHPFAAAVGALRAGGPPRRPGGHARARRLLLRPHRPLAAPARRGHEAAGRRRPCPAQMVEVERRARIFSHGATTLYPFQANLFGLPPEVVKECLLGVIEAKLQPPRRRAQELRGVLPAPLRRRASRSTS